MRNIKDQSTERGSNPVTQKCEAKYFIAEKNALDGKVELANQQLAAITRACPYPIESSWRSEYYVRRLKSQQ